VDAREPVISDVAPGITAIDTAMAGERELNAVYFLGGDEPCLVESGPGADLLVVTAALDRIGVGPEDLAHLVVTHIHLDHAGGAGALLRRFPAATLWVHERGAPHLVDPERLVASTIRTYGPDRMRRLFGETVPCPAARIRIVADGSVIPMGERRLEVLHTPGHASHHVSLLEDVSGAMFTGEAIGSYLPWGPAFRPALPPPEVDVGQALASISRMRAARPAILLTSHFGPVLDVERGFAVAAERVSAWAERARGVLAAQPFASDERLAAALTDLAREEFGRDASRPLDPELARYDALGSIRMNAQGLARYWRKRWEREFAPPRDPSVS
jgi:glyoxylase-like metal-dependent hydrolase (beta-lactamase superfamily II)